MPSRSKSILFGVLVLAASLPGVLHGRPDGLWRPIGPEGGYVQTIGTSPTAPALYLATGGGFDGGGLAYRAPDGITWAQGGAIAPFVLQIAVDSSDSNTAIAAADYFGVFRTTDGGKTWLSSLSGGNILASGVVSDPVTPGVFFVSTYTGVFKTTDAGLHWSGPRSLQIDCTAIAINPTNSLEIFATAYPGLLRSEDGGATWSTGLTQYFEYPSSLAFDAGGTVVYSSSVHGQVIRSADRGDHWESAGAPLPVEVSALTASRTAGVVFAGTRLGLFRSTDGGDHWAPTSIDQIMVLGLTSDSTGRVLAATSSGVFASADGGLSWLPWNAGFIRTSVISLAPSFADPGDLFCVGSDHFLSKWAHSSRQWAMLPTGALRDFDTGGGIGVVTTTVSDPSLVFAGYTVGCGYPSDTLHLNDTAPSLGPLFVSRDEGVTWSETSGVASACDTEFLMADPLDSSSLFMEHPNLGGNLERTADEGATWVGTGQVFSSMVFDPSSSPEIIVGSNGYTAARSVDGGRTWAALNAGLSIDHLATAAFGGEIYANSVDPLSQAPVTVYRSSDHGQTWGPTTFSSNAVSALAVDPQDSSRVFVASDRGIFEFPDRGNSWSQLPPFDISTLVSLAVAPGGSVLFASTWCCGVWEIDLRLRIQPIAPPIIAPVGPRSGTVAGRSVPVCVR